MKKHLFAAAVLATALVGPAWAQDERSVIIQGLPTNTASPASYGGGPAAPQLSLRTEPGNRPISIGERFNICFASSRDGYVSLWWIDAAGTVQRLYPNPWTATSTRVFANAESCVGRDGGPFTLTMGLPRGRNDLFLIWTATEQEQPSEAAFHNAAAGAGIGVQSQTVAAPGGQGGQFLTVQNGATGSVAALSVFSRAVRSVIVQPTVSQADWQTQHLLLQSGG